MLIANTSQAVRARCEDVVPVYLFRLFLRFGESGVVHVVCILVHMWYLVFGVSGLVR